jgi:hypothetical protein
MRDMMEGDGDRHTWTLSRLDDLLRTVARQTSRRMNQE